MYKPRVSAARGHAMQLAFDPVSAAALDAHFSVSASSQFDDPVLYGEDWQSIHHFSLHAHSGFRRRPLSSGRQLMAVPRHTRLRPPAKPPGPPDALRPPRPRPPSCRHQPSQPSRQPGSGSRHAPTSGHWPPPVQSCPYRASGTVTHNPSMSPGKQGAYGSVG